MPNYIQHRGLSQNSNDECIFTLPEDYGYVIIVAGMIGILCILQGFIVVGNRRKKFFTPEFMKQFETEHYQHFSNDIEKSQGYPDMGNGYYSQKLPYNQWVEFNQAQRVHYNFLEMATPTLLFILATGLEYPWVAVGLGSTKFVGRILTSRYVSDKGSQDIVRMIGQGLSELSMFTGFVFTVISGLKVSCVF